MASPNSTDSKETVYLSFDIEADGPSPANNSMIALGVCALLPVANDGVKTVMTKDYYLRKLDDKIVDEKTYTEFWSKHQDVYEHILKNGVPADEVMRDFYADYQALSRTYKVEWIASPAAFDWQWVSYYIRRFIKNPNIPYKATCISTMKDVMETLYVDMDGLEKFLEKFPLTHIPSDDAMRQGMKYIWLLRVQGIMRQCLTNWGKCD